MAFAGCRLALTRCDPINLALTHKKALLGGLFYGAGAPWWRPVGELTALARTLAGVLLAAGCNTTFQAHALATTGGIQGHAGHWLGLGSALAVCFGDDLVAHGRSLR